MSSTLRLSIILVFLLATTAFGLIAYNMNMPTVQVPIVQAAPAAPTPVYFVAKYSLPEGTLVREEYFRSQPLAEAPSGAFRDTPGDMSKLRGSLVRKFIYPGNAVTSQHVMLRDDQGFLSALAKLCQDEKADQKTTVRVYTPAKVDDYSVKKNDTKESAACAELDASSRNIAPTNASALPAKIDVSPGIAPSAPVASAVRR